jgi:FAD/FMN-containing dehydrogenase
MTLRPSTIDELRRALGKANADGARVTAVDLGRLARLREHAPEDMTCTVEAGLTLRALQAQLAGAGQWLPIDPPRPERLTIGALLDHNLSGPRRFGYGTIREHLIGIGVVLADGRFIQAGGKVVKNVAGYDLCKLFVGARGTLGVIVEATFKLRPLPAVERFVSAQCATLDELAALIGRVLDSSITPVVFDVSRVSGAAVTLVLGFAGTPAEVDWQLARAAEMGVAAPANLDYEHAFWSSGTDAVKLSVAPTKLIETLRSLGDAPFAARGVVPSAQGHLRPEAHSTGVVFVKSTRPNADSLSTRPYPAGARNQVSSPPSDGGEEKRGRTPPLRFLGPLPDQSRHA